MVLHPLIQRECCVCSHVPFSPFERVQTSFSAAGRHSSSTFPFLILESAYKAVGPGFSGPRDSWITAWTRLQVGMVNILPAWHYPPPLLPPPPVPCQAALAVTELMASSCRVLALWTLSWVAVWYTAGWSSLASPALLGVVMGNGRDGGGPVLVSLSTCRPSTFLVCISCSKGEEETLRDGGDRMLLTHF